MAGPGSLLVLLAVTAAALAEEGKLCWKACQEEDTVSPIQVRLSLAVCITHIPNNAWSYFTIQTHWTQRNSKTVDFERNVQLAATFSIAALGIQHRNGARTEYIMFFAVGTYVRVQ
jgi:hypothetical protein